MSSSRKQTVQLLRDMGFSEDIATRAVAECEENADIATVLECIERFENDNVKADQAYSEHSVKSSNEDKSSEQRTGDHSAVDSLASHQTLQGPGEEADLTADDLMVLRCEQCNQLFGKEKASRHAEVSGHCNFVQATQQEKLDRIKQMRKGLEAHRQREEIEREKRRRQDGKKVGTVRSEMKQLELKRAAEERIRDRKLDELHRQRIKSQIKADRAAMKLKRQTTPVVDSGMAAESTPASVGSGECRIMVRLGDGRCLVNTFKQREPLSAVMLWIKLNHPDGDIPEGIRILQSYPRREFSESEMQMSLDELQLGSSNVFMIR